MKTRTIFVVVAAFTIAVLLGIGLSRGFVKDDEKMQQFYRDNEDHIRVMQQADEEVKAFSKRIDAELLESEIRFRDPAYQARLKYDLWKAGKAVEAERPKSK